jgi:hypothetical protein
MGKREGKEERRRGEGRGGAKACIGPPPLFQILDTPLVGPALVIPRRKINRLHSVSAEPYGGDPVFFVFVVDVVSGVRVDDFGQIHCVFSLETDSFG